MKQTTTALLLVLICLFLITADAKYRTFKRAKSPLFHREAKRYLNQQATGCNDTQDLAVFNKSYTIFHTRVKTCAQECLATKECTQTCLIKDLGLTDTCATCFADSVWCTAENCAIYCTVAPDSKSCLDCEKQYCQAALVKCAGVDESVIPP